jgi:hypothetical protein
LRGYWKKSGLPEFMWGGGKSNRLKTQYVDCWLFSETGRAISHRSKGLDWIFMSNSRNSHHQVCAKMENIQTNSDYYFHLIDTIRHQNLDFKNKPIKIKIRIRGMEALFDKYTEKNTFPKIGFHLTIPRAMTRFSTKSRNHWCCPELPGHNINYSQAFAKSVLIIIRRAAAILIAAAGTERIWCVRCGGARSHVRLPALVSESRATVYTQNKLFIARAARARSALAVRNNCALQQTNTRSGFGGGVIHLETSTLAEDHGIVCAQRARGKIRPSSGRTQNTFFSQMWSATGTPPVGLTKTKQRDPR